MSDAPPMSDARGRAALSAARERAERVVSLGARLADAASPLGVEARTRLAQVSELSPEGIDLALREHLETNASPAELDLLVARAGRAPRCHVVLAANVCTGALRAVALAVAAAPAVALRPSRRDPVLAEILARELACDAVFAQLGGSISVVSALEPSPGDLVHAYGSDATMAALRASLPSGVVLRGHGSGFGVAVVAAGADLAAAASGVARDVVPFDQAGCLSPRVVLVESPPGHAARAEAFASALDAELARWADRVPRGALDAPTQAAIALYGASLEAIGFTWAGREHLIGLDPAPRALVLPPAARVVHVVALDAGAAHSLLAPWAPQITALGVDGDGPLAAAAFAVAPHARMSRLGRMQRPPLDGPVDLRSLA